MVLLLMLAQIKESKVKQGVFGTPHTGCFFNSSALKRGQTLGKIRHFFMGFTM